MKKITRTSHIIFISVLGFFLIPALVWSDNPQLEWTEQEKKWLNKNPVLNMVINQAPAPVSFWDTPLPPNQPFHPPRPHIQKPYKAFPDKDDFDEQSNTPIHPPRPQHERNFQPPRPHVFPESPGRDRADFALIPVLEEEQEKFKGVAADYLKEIENATGITFKIRYRSIDHFEGIQKALLDGEVDLMPSKIIGAREYPGIVLTQPYLHIPVVIVTRKDTPYIENLNMLTKMKVGGSIPIFPKLHDLGLELNIEHYPPKIGLHNVATGRLDAFLCELFGVSESLSGNPLPNIKISGELPAPSLFTVMVSHQKKEFVPIFNKALNAISKETKNKIWNKWFPVDYVKKEEASFNWMKTLISLIGILLITSCCIIFFLNRRFKRIKAAVSALDPHLLSVHVDHNIMITDTTDAFCKAIGFKTEDLIGRPLMTLGSPVSENKNSLSQIWDTLKQGNPWKGEVQLIKKDGSILWAEAAISPLRRKNEKKEGYTVIYQDVTQLKHFEKLATRDELTGLYNRRHFNELAPVLLKKAKSTDRIFVLLLMDVDNFKKYNDRYGHPAGDKVLSMIGKKLRSSFKRTNDIVFRLGGEEFGAVILVSSTEDCLKIGQKILKQIQDLKIDHELNTPGVVTISMGIHTVESNNSIDLQTVYKKADQALYRAKENGRNQLAVSQ